MKRFLIQLKFNRVFLKMNVSDKTLVVFQGRKIRRTWFNHEWWFAAIDIVEALTDSRDPSGYLKDMRRRDEGFREGWEQIATPLAVSTPGGKQRISCVSTKGAFRLIQSVPSKTSWPAGFLQPS